MVVSYDQSIANVGYENAKPVVLDLWRDFWAQHGNGETN